MDYPINIKLRLVRRESSKSKHTKLLAEAIFQWSGLVIFIFFQLSLPPLIPETHLKLDICCSVIIAVFLFENTASKRYYKLNIQEIGVDRLVKPGSGSKDLK